MHSSADEHLSCLHLGAIKISTLMNILMYISDGHIPRSEISGPQSCW